jgi:stage II sporulation protein GA (sporulation sigma-E factor processing peptidase)
VYVDVLGVVHAVCNGVWLLVLAKVLREAIIWWRIACAAVLGAVPIVWVALSGYNSVWTFFACTPLLLVIAYRWRGGRHLVWQTAVCTVFGACAVGISIVVSQRVQALTVSTIALVCACAAVGVSCVRAYRRVQRHVVPIEVHIGRITVRAQGLIDTGHHLCDPLTRTPVLIMDARQWIDDVPIGWRDAVLSGDVLRVCHDARAEDEEVQWERRFRCVPYRGVGRDQQWMVAFSPDAVRIDDRQWCRGRVLIGLRAGTLRADDAYAALIPMALVG